jgi:hypothetical protein
MEYSTVGAGSPRELNAESVCCLSTDDLKPALVTQQQIIFVNVKNLHTSNNPRAGFKSTANHSIYGLHKQLANEPAPTKITKTLCFTNFEKEML